MRRSDLIAMRGFVLAYFLDHFRCLFSTLLVALQDTYFDLLWSTDQEKLSHSVRKMDKHHIDEATTAAKYGNGRFGDISNLMNIIIAPIALTFALLSVLIAYLQLRRRVAAPSTSRQLSPIEVDQVPIWDISGEDHPLLHIKGC